MSVRSDLHHIRSRMLIQTSEWKRNFDGALGYYSRAGKSW
jgi:hypothetical protein